ncbi:hypothetical protein KSS87_007851, partial [Heliosperma pusillum]
MFNTGSTLILSFNGEFSHLRQCTPPVRRNSSLKMKPVCEETVSGQLNTVDRLSDLPDFIVHHIISFLDTREAYRTSILSKRWAYISATNPILEFHFYWKPNKSYDSRYWPSKEVAARLVEYIDTRMQKYAKENLRVRTLRLTFPNFDVMT